MVYRRFQRGLLSMVRAIYTRQHPTFQRRQSQLRQALSRAVPVDEPDSDLYHARMAEAETPGAGGHDDDDDG